MATSTAAAKADRDSLEEFVKGGAFLKFDTLNPVEGIYRGNTPNEFTGSDGKTVKTLDYAIEIEGEVKTLSVGSKRLAQAMLDNDVTIGDFVRITRTGGGFDTYYEIEVSKDGVPF